jgi:hypothetical protein
MKKVSPEKYNAKVAKARFDKALNGALEASRKPMTITATLKRRALKKRPGKGVQSR